MRKILFNDKFGLTQAVLDGRKTMMRLSIGNRLTADDIKAYYDGKLTAADIKTSHYHVGEVVAIAQSYETINNTLYKDDFTRQFNLICRVEKAHGLLKNDIIGWRNKMFVCAEFMPHRILITNIKIERLQDISEDDCLKEGVWIDSHREVLDDNIYTIDVFGKHYCQWHFPSAREAFSFLIDKVSGKGTWESNPFVFVYTFEIVK